jgi:hypothetical protein
MKRQSYGFRNKEYFKLKILAIGFFEFGQAVENAPKVHERILTIPNKNRKRKKRKLTDTS